MSSLPHISLSPVSTSAQHSPGNAQVHHIGASVPAMNLPSLAYSPMRNPQMSALPLLGGDDDDDSSVSSADSGSTSGSETSFEHLSAQVSHSVSTPVPPGSKGAGSKFDFNVGTPTSTATTRHSSFSSSESDARKLIVPLRSVHSGGVNTSGDKSPIMYDNNGRRKSNAGLGAEEHSPHAAGHPHHHQHQHQHQHHHHNRQLEADLLNHRHLVVLSNENATNIARIHIEVDPKAASAMAARAFVDTNTIQVHQTAHQSHQRRASHDHLAPLPAVRRSSLTNQQQAVPQSLSPLYMNAAHISGYNNTSAAEGRIPAHAVGQLTHAGRVISNSTRLMKSGVPERTVGRVECLADLHNSSFNQPRFAQQTVGSLMGIKNAQ